MPPDPVTITVAIVASTIASVGSSIGAMAQAASAAKKQQAANQRLAALRNAQAEADMISLTMAKAQEGRRELARQQAASTGMYGATLDALENDQLGEYFQQTREGGTQVAMDRDAYIYQRDMESAVIGMQEDQAMWQGGSQIIGAIGSGISAYGKATNYGVKRTEAIG
tara:strand:- start:12899 stop:13402 length:504 start_codon:yes stop_codon:yes gene_type:complete